MINKQQQQQQTHDTCIVITFLHAAITMLSTQQSLSTSLLLSSPPITSRYEVSLPVVITVLAWLYLPIGQLLTEEYCNC